MDLINKKNRIMNGVYLMDYQLYSMIMDKKKKRGVIENGYKDGL